MNKTYDEMNNDEICSENNCREKQESLECYPLMLQDFSSLSLKRINIARDNCNNHESHDVNDISYYLFGINGVWRISKANRNYWNDGWEFDMGWGKYTLGNIDMLFEIENMPSYKSKPLGRLEYHSYDWEEE